MKTSKCKFFKEGLLICTSFTPFRAYPVPLQTGDIQQVLNWMQLILIGDALVHGDWRRNGDISAVLLTSLCSNISFE